jgi:hypothetical protein
MYRTSTSRYKIHRKSRSQIQRMQLASKQRWRCASCSRLLSWSFEVDHIVALCNGGSDTIQNLQVLCCTCHSEKTYSDLFENILDDEDKVNDTNKVNNNSDNDDDDDDDDDEKNLQTELTSPYFLNYQQNDWESILEKFKYKQPSK